LVGCTEGLEFSSNTDDSVFSRYEGHPVFDRMSRFHHKFKCPGFLICVKKNAGNSKSSIPTLILSCEFDPKTPLDGAKSAFTKFQNGYLYVFPDRSHNAASHPCARKLIETFLENPSIQPNQNCMEQIQRIKSEPKV
jgi:pimeloyl-ACP methyl ester carboxylesterase